MAPGQPLREDYEYQRHGTCALFLAVEPLVGQRQVWVRERRTKLDCAEVLRDLVDVVYPDAEKIVLVVDNLNIHHPACLYERFPSPSVLNGITHPQPAGSILPRLNCRCSGRGSTHRRAY
jgi:hypothetical protein